MEKKYNFVYLTTNLINGKQYVGDHSTDNLNDNYLGSGNLIVEAVRKYGKENFNREILEFFSTKKEAFDAQERYIEKYSTLSHGSNLGYNISPKGGHNVKNCFSDESKEKIRLGKSGKPSWNKGLKMSEDFCLKLKKAFKNRPPLPESALKSISEKNRGNKWNVGKIRSEESKKKQSNSIKGEKNHFFGKTHSDETKQKIRANRKDTSGENNPMFNHTYSDETRKKMSDAKKGKKFSELHIQHLIEANQGEKNGMFGKKQSDATKEKMKESWRKRKELKI